MRLLNVVNFLDTPVCHVETRRWEKLRADLPSDARIYTISMDLPFGQARWRRAEGVEHDALSAHVPPGIIGEIGTGAPMTAAEERVLRAMAWAQRETGLAITVHVHPWGRGGHRVLDALFAEGVAAERVILNHAFVDVEDPAYEEALLARGATLGYDMFGFDHSLFRVGRYPPPDFDVAAEVARLVAAGYAPQLILSQDVRVKTRLRAFGGWGYAHVLEHVVPLLGELGVTDEQMSQMLVANPSGLLTRR